MNLYISCDGGSSSDVVLYAQQYHWQYGSCEVILQEKQLGVDLHNLACMRLAEKLGNVVVLEDDLVVSPSFQIYLLAMESLAKTEKSLAGISLYRYPMIEQTHFPFQLVPNDEFVYYQQRPSSNGCFYTWEMLEPYFTYLASFRNNFGDYKLPQNVLNWGDEVWEKSFYCYLQESGKYLVFPRYSLSTDFADVGVHMQKQTNKYAHQSPLFLGSAIPDPLTIGDSINVFDAFYEISSSVIKKYLPELREFDFEVDLNGYKDLSASKFKYALSSKKCIEPMLGWDRRLKPEVNNVLLNEKGTFYSFGKIESFKGGATKNNLAEKFLYYYPDTRLLDLVKMKIVEIISRFV